MSGYDSAPAVTRRVKCGAGQRRRALLGRIGKVGIAVLAGLAGAGLAGFLAAGPAAAAVPTYSEAAAFPVESNGTGSTTIGIQPAAATDLVVLYVEVHSTTTTVTGVSSPNVAWTDEVAAETFSG
ncbi:MAG: hypothetical protein ACRDWN_08970, partial [Acidimicrobiales bacterium]